MVQAHQFCLSGWQHLSVHSGGCQSTMHTVPGPEGTLSKKHHFFTEENLHTPGYTCRNRQENSETLAKAGPRNTCTYIHYHIYIHAQTNIICTYHTITTGTHEYDCAVLCITKIGCKHPEKVRTTWHSRIKRLSWKVLQMSKEKHNHRTLWHWHMQYTKPKSI